MRSHAIFRRSRSLLKVSTIPNTTLCSSPRLRRVSRKEQPPPRPPARVYKRLASSTQEIPQKDETPIATASPEEPPSEKPDVTQESIKSSSLSSPRVVVNAVEDHPKLPSDLNVLWIPDENEQLDDESSLAGLPPPEVFDEALTNLLITLHPQTQHRAAYASPAGLPLEPTLALYCPIEGGDYVIDETVWELARRTGSEVLIIDAVQLAAGECGHFGKAANSLQLPRNPLHFPSPTPQSSHTSPPSLDEDDFDTLPGFGIPSQMTLHVLTPSASRNRAQALVSSRSNSPSRIKSFFNDLVNIPSPSSSTTRPRLIYIRDFPTLASTSSTWYPPLLSAVRQRRAGPIAGQVNTPMTIIFGVTPPIVPLASMPVVSSTGTLVNMRMDTSTVAPSNCRPSGGVWGEDDAADRAREKRLKERLKKWEKDERALIDELPKLLTKNDEGAGGYVKKPGVVVIGPGGGLLDSLLGNADSSAGGSRFAESESSHAKFFRTSVIVPQTRSVVRERLCRTDRRREINELTMRMGVRAVGGVLEKAETPRLESCKDTTGGNTEGEVQQEVATAMDKDSKAEDMWRDWSNKVEVWADVRQVADRALGSVVGSSPLWRKPSSSNLEPTAVSWSAVHKAWAAQHLVHSMRKSWLKNAMVKIPKDKEEDVDDEVEETEVVDEVVKKIKQDPELEHEQRLLACIVDAASMSTTFSQVHLPPHTIDSVRTIVSLPLLHPAAFKQGILKEHGMTGCLLFGPPGTGKTLVVRALAKEAGCRMLAISPSDVMDMYVGEGEKLVKAVFSLARRLSPCVVFLDEIDALFGARTSSRQSGGALAHRGVITEFMQEMDGLKTSKEERVIVIGATNRPFDLDDAVLRRLPRRLLVDLPGEKEREEILKILLCEETLSTEEVDLRALAKHTEGFSGSDLKHLCVSAALDAVKEHVEVPWKQPSRPLGTSSSTTATSVNPPLEKGEVADASESASSTRATPARVLHLRHFTKALKEITPSSSESLGSLADLRRWNEEFGEGRKDKKKQQVWGKDKFGFINTPNSTSGEDGRIAPPATATSG